MSNDKSEGKTEPTDAEVDPIEAAEQEALENAQQTAEDLTNVVLQQQAPPGTPIPRPRDDDYVLPEPDTDSVPPSDVTGQTADESQDKSEE
jgi:hypothetical protein